MLFGLTPFWTPFDQDQNPVETVLSAAKKQSKTKTLQQFISKTQLGFSKNLDFQRTKVLPLKNIREAIELYLEPDEDLVENEAGLGANLYD